MSNCKNCGNFKSVSESHGKCHVNPPLASLVPVQNIGGQGLSVVTYFPEVRNEDWCGKWVPDIAEGQKQGTLLQMN